VVTHVDERNHGLLRSELQQLARGDLAPFKVPRQIQFVEALPRTTTGKPRRFLLREGTW
jgi:acyl-coenzyme A synthetase/AMP-(fatty) acid ligase